MSDWVIPGRARLRLGVRPSPQRSAKAGLSRFAAIASRGRPEWSRPVAFALITAASGGSRSGSRTLKRPALIWPSSRRRTRSLAMG